MVMLRLLLIMSILPWATDGACSMRPFIAETAVLADPSGTLTIHDVAGPAFSDRFTPVRFPDPLDKDNNVYWIKLLIQFPPGVSKDGWVIDLNWNYLRSIALYAPKTPGAEPFIIEDWDGYIESIVPIPVTQDDTVECYVRVVGYGGLNPNFVISSVSDADSRQSLRKSLIWIFFGILLAMFVYNSFLFFALKDASYLWYVLHIAFLARYCLFMNGLSYDYHYGGVEDKFLSNLRMLTIDTGFMFLCMVLFTRSFLLTKIYSKKIDNLMMVLIGVCSLYLASSFVAHPLVSANIGPLVGMVAAFTILICSLIRLFQGFRPAIFFVPGWLVYMTCGSVHSMAWAGVLPANAFTTYAPEIGSSIEVMVMSLALAYRVRILREEKDATEADKKRLAEKTALFTILLDYSKLGIGLVKHDAFSWANKQLQTIVGNDNRLKGMRLQDVVGLHELLETPKRSASGGGIVKEGRIMTNGALKDLRALGQVVDPPYAELGTVWVIEDVSEQKRLERLREDIDQIVRHDLKTPLATIRSLQGVIEKVGPLNEQQKRLLEMIRESSSQGLRSLTMALTLYRIEAGNFALEPSEVDLAQAVADALDELRPQGSERFRVNGFDTRVSSPVVSGDGSLVHAVLVNLFKNALEAMPDGGEIRVVFKERQATLCVRVTNPGEVPGEIRDRFFEKFVTSGKHAGTGLGTYSARLIARALGGEVALDTSKPGYTSVTACFPKARRREVSSS